MEGRFDAWQPTIFISSWNYCTVPSVGFHIVIGVILVNAMEPHAHTHTRPTPMSTTCWHLRAKEKIPMTFVSTLGPEEQE